MSPARRHLCIFSLYLGMTEVGFTLSTSVWQPTFSWTGLCYACLFVCIRIISISKSRLEHLRVASPKGDALLCGPRKGFWPDVYFLPWDSYLFQIMSDGIGAARRRQLRCRKWIRIVVRRCSYTLATKAVLPSIHHARSVISRSGAVLRHRHYLIEIYIYWFFLDLNPHS